MLLRLSRYLAFIITLLVASSFLNGAFGIRSDWFTAPIEISQLIVTVFFIVGFARCTDLLFMYFYRSLVKPKITN